MSRMSRIVSARPLVCLALGLLVVGLPELAEAALRDLQIRFQTSPGAVAYKVHLGIAPGAYIRVDEIRPGAPGSGAVVSRVVAGLPDDLAVYVAVTAVDARGNQSAFSREIVVPASRPGGACFFDSQCFNGRPVACVNMKCGGQIPLGIETFASDLVAPQPPGSRVLFGVWARGGSGRHEFAWYHRVNGGPWILDRDFDTSPYLELTLPDVRGGLVEIGVAVRNEGEHQPSDLKSMQIYPYRVS